MGSDRQGRGWEKCGRETDGKGFYEEPYSAAAMTRALEGGEDQHPIRRALGQDLEPKYCAVVDEILKELEE